MNDKKTRLQIIEYCKNCKNVKNAGGTTLCGLTNQMASFDFECDKFQYIAAKEDGQKESFFGSWKSALVLSILGFVRFGLKMADGKLDIFGLIFLILGFAWLCIALFGNKD